MDIKNLLSGICLALVGAAAQAAPLVIRDGYVEAGVSDLYGTLGSNHSASPGILFDPTGTSNYGVNDFLTPGSPFEGFYLVADGGLTWSSNNNGGGYGFVSPFTLTQLSPTRVTAASSTTDRALSILHDYQLSRSGTRSEIKISTTITNLSGTPITGLKLLRTLDPDPDVNTYGSYDTVNSVPSSTRACGSGTLTDQTICIEAASTSFSPNAGVSGPSWSTDPNLYLAGVNDGDGDNAIGLAYNVGTLAPGASVTLQYTYVLSNTRAGTDPVAVPALSPLGLAALSGGLFLVAGWRRRQIQRKK